MGYKEVPAGLGTRGFKIQGTSSQVSLSIRHHAKHTGGSKKMFAMASALQMGSTYLGKKEAGQELYKQGIGVGHTGNRQRMCPVNP